MRVYECMYFLCVGVGVGVGLWVWVWVTGKGPGLVFLVNNGWTTAIWPAKKWNSMKPGQSLRE